MRPDDIVAPISFHGSIRLTDTIAQTGISPSLLSLDFFHFSPFQKSSLFLNLSIPFHRTVQDHDPKPDSPMHEKNHGGFLPHPGNGYKSKWKYLQQGQVSRCRNEMQ